MRNVNDIKQAFLKLNGFEQKARELNAKNYEPIYKLMRDFMMNNQGLGAIECIYKSCTNVLIGRAAQELFYDLKK